MHGQLGLCCCWQLLSPLSMLPVHGLCVSLHVSKVVL